MYDVLCLSLIKNKKIIQHFLSLIFKYRYLIVLTVGIPLFSSEIYKEFFDNVHYQCEHNAELIVKIRNYSSLSYLPLCPIHFIEFYLLQDNTMASRTLQFTDAGDKLYQDKLLGCN